MNTFSFFLYLFYKQTFAKQYIRTHSCRHGVVKFFNYNLTVIAGLNISGAMIRLKVIKDTETHSSARPSLSDMCCQLKLAVE